MKVVVVGTGYVGLVTGACFAEFGASVLCVDNNEDKIDQLKRGLIPIYEPGLDSIVERNVLNGNLTFTSKLSSNISDAELIFIAVGTPTREEDGHADLKYVFGVAEEIAPELNDFTLVVDKSTVPVGTAKKVKEIISKINPEAKFEVASNPEFLREGSAIKDFMKPDRIVIGVESKRSENLLKKLYKPLEDIDTPILVTDPESAELIKYASNAFLATKISFINEMSILCEQTGADVDLVAKGMGMDKRIGDKFLNAGPGYGGSCFPKDTKALSSIAKEYSVRSKIVDSVIEVNDHQKNRMVEKIRKSIGGSEDGVQITFLGLTFKPLTDDMRDSPSLSIIPPLVSNGAKVLAHDPAGINEARDLLPEEVSYFESIDEAVTNSDALVLMTEWDEYCDLDLSKIRSLMKGDIFVDLRNIYSPNEMSNLGFQYFSIGR